MKSAEKRLRIFIFLHFLRNEFQSKTIVAISLPGGGWPIIKDVPLVAFTSGAMIFCSRIENFPVGFCLNMIFNGLCEARPPCFAVVFCVEFKERQLACGTNKCSLPLFSIKRATMSRFSSFVAQNFILFWR